MSVLGDLPEGVESAMFLRDGWPDAVVCKVKMKTGCIGVGLWRSVAPYYRLPPEAADSSALANAIAHVSAEPPDYTELQEYVQRIADAAKARAEPDHDLQASLGSPAHE
jgi:hypothetical protein